MYRVGHSEEIKKNGWGRGRVTGTKGRVFLFKEHPSTSLSCARRSHSGPDQQRSALWRKKSKDRNVIPLSCVCVCGPWVRSCTEGPSHKMAPLFPPSFTVQSTVAVSQITHYIRRHCGCVLNHTSCNGALDTCWWNKSLRILHVSFMSQWQATPNFQDKDVPPCVLLQHPNIFNPPSDFVMSSEWHSCPYHHHQSHFQYYHSIVS